MTEQFLSRGQLSREALLPPQSATAPSLQQEEEREVEEQQQRAAGPCLVERQSEQHVAEEGSELRCFNPCSAKAALPF